jgi:PAS domain S-box-containing protein
LSLQCPDSDSGPEGRGSQIAGVQVGCGQENPQPVTQDRRDRMNKIRQLLWNVISSGLPSSSDIEVLRKMVLLNLMFLFGGTCLFLFIIVAYAKEDILLAAVDSTFLAFLITLFVYLRKTGNYRRTGALGATATGLFFTFQIAYGSISPTALIWSLTYPLIALFLLGLKRGVQMSLLLLVLAIAIFILGKEVSWLTVYQTDVIVRFIPAYLIIFFFSFSMEKVRDTVHGRLEASNLELRNALDEVREGTAALAESNRELRVEITERKQVEEALKQSEEKYRAILENIEEGYYEVDIAGNFTFLNDSMCRIFGYPKEELIGMNDRQYTDQETAKRLFQAYNKVYRTGIPDRGYDYEIIRKDRTKRYVEVSISLQKDSSGKTIGFKGIIRDVTEHKSAEEDLRRSEKKFKELFDNAPVGYHEFDIEGRIINVNRTELEMLG